jgi:hypothetical protein
MLRAHRSRGEAGWVVKDQLADLWGAWSDDGSMSALLVVALIVAAVLWFASSFLVSRSAARRWRSPYAWGLAVTIPATLVLAIGLFWPSSFHWWAIGAGVFSVAVALFDRWLIDRAVTTCSQGHELSPSWVHCPMCAPPKPAQMPIPVGGARLAGANPAQAPIGQGLGVGTVAPAGVAYGGAAPSPRVKSGAVMIRLIPERRGLPDETVHTSGALIGRSPDSDIVLDDSSVSWEHARVIERQGSPAVVDLGSSNGTFVNEERIETSLLISGDKLRIGDTVFRVLS